jgi:hypothetical protein
MDCRIRACARRHDGLADHALDTRRAMPLAPGEHITIDSPPSALSFLFEGVMSSLFALLRWLLAMPCSLILVLVAWALAPMLALTAFATEDAVSKEGNLPRRLRWFQTHDHPLDELWRPSLPGEAWRAPALYLRGSATLAGRTAADIQASARLRWWARTLWLWRNPAYGWRAHVFGYRHAPGEVVRLRRWGDRDTPHSSVELRTAARPGCCLTARAWHLHARLFYTRSRYVRINLGWKLVMPGIAMLAAHVHPCRKWRRRGAAGRD